MSAKGGGGGGEAGGRDVVLAGYLKKLKTMRRKWFVLRAESSEASARLEYYDSRKKELQRQTPKRSIPLRACFNINRRLDTKHKHVIALYTKDDCFCVVLDSERDLDAWLKALLSLQRGDDAPDGEPPRPHFEHVWQVQMLSKGLGTSRSIRGAYHLCLTEKTLSLVRKSGWHQHHSQQHPCSQQQNDTIEFSLMSIRRCGHSECFFYMEVGRSAVTGAGELWMQTEDPNIAQNMDEVILRAMSNNNSKEEPLGPKIRIRSSSATESSKPILVQRIPSHSGSHKPPSYCSPSQVSGTTTWSGMAHHQRTQSLPLATIPSHIHPDNNNPCAIHGSGLGSGTCCHRNNKLRHNNNTSTRPGGGSRERCDSMPSRPRTTSEGYGVRHQIPHRPQSLYSHSPPHAGSPASPTSAACSTDSAGSSLSIDEPDNWPLLHDHSHHIHDQHHPTYQQVGPPSRYSHSLTPDEPIVEENCDSPEPGSYVPMAPIPSEEGYVDMSPRGRHTTDMSPAASSCSVTSGTPSTDLRFSEYHLEKVSSYFTPSEEDDTSSAERPIRAYSVGSRPEPTRFLSSSISAANSGKVHENARVRAFSVGSRSKPLHHATRILPSHSSHSSSNNNNGKSSSAPLLNHSGSHSSVEPMDDLMEMDFSKPNLAHPGYVDMSPRNCGYVQMKPGVMADSEPYMETTPSKSSDIHQQPYVDMRPASSPMQCPSVRDPQSAYVDMRPSTSPHKPPSSAPKNSNYVDMSVGKSPPKTASPIQEEYMDMDFHTATPSTTSSLTGKSPDGYMDMSWSSGRKSSFDNTSSARDDYVNMSASRTRKERRGSKKDKTCSQPIAIAQPSSSFCTYVQRNSPKQQPPTYLPLSASPSGPVSSSPFSSLRRQRSRNSSRRDSKDSVTITPTSDQSTIFPFSPGSPVKPFHQVNSPESAMSRKCAVDASSGTVRLARTSDYLQMSPSSAQSPPKSQQLPPVPTTPTTPLTPTATSTSTVSDYINFCPRPGVNIPNTTPLTITTTTTTDDYGEYAVMKPVVSFSQSRKPAVPFAGTITKQLSGLSVGPKPCVFRPIAEPDDGNVRASGASSPRPGDVAPHRSFENLRSGAGADAGYETLSPVAKVSRPSSVVGSRPASVSSDRSRPSSVSSEIGRCGGSGSGSLSRPSSVSSEIGSTSSTVVGSRPESVCDTTRPPSVSSERELHYASLDLAPADDDGTKSPRQAKDNTRSPTPGTSGEPCFTYAEIDFARSESVKQANITKNKQ